MSLKAFTTLVLGFAALHATIGMPTATTSSFITAAPVITKRAMPDTYQPGLDGAEIDNAPQTIQNIIKGPDHITFHITNLHTIDVSTAHVLAEHSPELVNRPIATTIMPRGATATYAVPSGWEGRLAVVEAHGKFMGAESLIEANYVTPGGETESVFDIDVSYVDGFSVPIVCSCDDQGLITGCNKNLWKGGCPAGWDNGVGSCRNPLRSDLGATAPTSFFAPCQHLAYTYVNDHGGNSYGACQKSGQVHCCIGTACPARG